MKKNLQKSSTEGSGNTTQTLQKRIQARAYQLTLNRIETYEDVKNYIIGKKPFNFLISCNEIAPTTKKKHIHIYVHYKQAVQLNINKLHGAHVEICRGSPQQNIKYIEKDGDIIEEIGKRPNQGGMTVGDLKEVKDEDTLPWQMRNTWKKIKEEEEGIYTIDDFIKDVKVYYIQGESGTGKTNKAIEIIKENSEKYGKHFSNIKHKNDFWLGVRETKIALYDEFRDSHMKPSEFINFIDYNVHPMNIKGGSIKNKFELIIITSVIKIDELYKNIGDEPRKQWMRRVEVIDMDQIEKKGYKIN